MAQPKPTKESHWLNKSQMALSLGISVQAFDKWGVKPIEKIGRESFYTARDVLDNRLAHAEQKANPEPLDTVPGTIEYERLRLTREQADQLELKNEQARGKVVPIDLFITVLSQISAEAGGILDTTPLQIKRKHPELETPIIESIKHQITKAQNSIARTDAIAVRAVEDYVASLDSD